MLQFPGCASFDISVINSHFRGGALCQTLYWVCNGYCFIPFNCTETQELEFSFFCEIKLRLRNDVYQDAPMVQAHGRRAVYSYSFNFLLPSSLLPCLPALSPSSATSDF